MKSKADKSDYVRKNVINRKNIDTKSHLRYKHVLNEMLQGVTGDALEEVQKIKQMVENDKTTAAELYQYSKPMDDIDQRHSTSYFGRATRPLWQIQGICVSGSQKRSQSSFE